MRTTAPSRLAAAALAAAALLAAPSGAAAQEGVNAVSRHVESLEIAPGAEHRLVVLHPVLARTPDAAAAQKPLRFAGTMGPEEVAFGRMSVAVRSRVEVASFAPGAALLLEGDVLRTPTADLVVTSSVMLPAGETAEVPVERVSRESEPDARTVETRELGPVLPSALRYLVLAKTPGAGLRAECDRWADLVRLDTPRRSPAELSSSKLVAARAADYRKRFATLGVPGGAADREVVGYALLLDGDFAAMETFGSAAGFAAAWPRVLEGIAAEAVALEAENGLLDADLADPADPDRFLADVKKRLLDVFAARPSVRDLAGSRARRYELDVPRAIVRAVVLPGDRVEHFVLIVDPTRRAQKPSGEGVDLAAARRKARPTGEEQRLLERRGQGTPPAPQPPIPPPAPPTPQPE